MKKFVLVLAVILALTVLAGGVYLAERKSPPPGGAIEHTIPDDRIAK